MSFTLWSPPEATEEDLLVMELPRELLAGLERCHARAGGEGGEEGSAGADAGAGAGANAGNGLGEGKRGGAGGDTPGAAAEDPSTAPFAADVVFQGPDSQAYFVTPTATYELRFLDSTNTHAIVDAPPESLAPGGPARELRVLRFYSSVVEFRRCCPAISELVAAVPLLHPGAPPRGQFYLSAFPRERVIGSPAEVFSRLAGLWCCKYPGGQGGPGGALVAPGGGSEQPMAVFDLCACCPGLAHLCAARVDRGTGECRSPVSEAVDALVSTADGVSEPVAYSVLPFLCRAVDGREAGPELFSRWLRTDAFPKYNPFGEVEISPLKVLSGLLLDLVARMTRLARSRAARGGLGGSGPAGGLTGGLGGPGDIAGSLELQRALERLAPGESAAEVASGAEPLSPAGRGYHSAPFTLGALARRLGAEGYPPEFYIAAASEAYAHAGELELGADLGALGGVGAGGAEAAAGGEAGGGSASAGVGAGAAAAAATAAAPGAGAGASAPPITALYDLEAERPTPLLLAAALLPRPTSSRYWTPAANCWLDLRAPVGEDTRAVWFNRKELPAHALQRLFALADAEPGAAWHGAGLTHICSECCESHQAADAAVLAATRRCGAACDGHDLLRVKAEKRYALGAAELFRRPG